MTKVYHDTISRLIPIAHLLVGRDGIQHQLNRFCCNFRSIARLKLDYNSDSEAVLVHRLINALRISSSIKLNKIMKNLILSLFLILSFSFANAQVEPPTNVTVHKTQGGQGRQYAYIIFESAYDFDGTVSITILRDGEPIQTDWYYTAPAGMRVVHYPDRFKANRQTVYEVQICKDGECSEFVTAEWINETKL